MKVFKLLRYVLVSVFLIGGASVVNAQDEDLPEVVYGEDMAYGSSISGYGTMSGAGKIYMEVWFSDSYAIGGRYYYVKTNKGRREKAWIYLSGTASFDSYGYPSYLSLEEDAYGSKNGSFEGSISRSGVYKGTFYRNDGKRFSFNVKLK